MVIHEPKLGVGLPRILAGVGRLTKLGWELGPPDRLAEDAGTRGLGRWTAVMLGIIPPASLWLIPPRLTFVLVVAPSIKGGLVVHVGANPLEDGFDLAPPSGLTGSGPWTEATFSGGGRFLGQSA